MTNSTKKLIEAGELSERFKYLGIKAIYGLRKGHGFWIEGHGWKTVAACKRILKNRDSVSVAIYE